MTTTNNPIGNDSDMRPEYDFTGGARGKHYRAYREGHTVKIYQEDGTVIVQEYKLEKNAVVIEPDVKEYFPDSESVNQALRSLIALIPTKNKVGAKSRRRGSFGGQKNVGNQPTQQSGS
jgi:hypothetical protein